MHAAVCHLLCEDTWVFQFLATMTKAAINFLLRLRRVVFHLPNASRRCREDAKTLFFLLPRTAEPGTPTHRTTTATVLGASAHTRSRRAQVTACNASGCAGPTPGARGALTCLRSMAPPDACPGSAALPGVAWASRGQASARGFAGAGVGGVGGTGAADRKRFWAGRVSGTAKWLRFNFTFVSPEGQPLWKLWSGAGLGQPERRSYRIPRGGARAARGGGASASRGAGLGQPEGRG